MQLSSHSVLLGVTSSLLAVLVCSIALWRRLYLRLPLFTAYLVLLAGRDALAWWFYLDLGYTSRAASYYYWITQGILVTARAAAVAEIAWRALREYRGVWALAWRVLLIIALFLLLQATLDARGSRAWISPLILTAERGLELAAVGILVLLLAICRYYGIQLEPVQKMIALGLGFYSAIQVLNNSVLRVTHYFPMWNEIRIISFQVALVIWLLALLRPLPKAVPAPALLSQSVYDELSPQVNQRLRVLNQRLLEILKS